MRVSVLRGVKDLAVEERPVPQAGRGEVLVQIGSVGVCGSDVHYYVHGRIADFVVRNPLILGHEAGGRIGAAGGWGSVAPTCPPTCTAGSPTSSYGTR